MNKRYYNQLTTEQFVEKAKQKHGDWYCYDSVQYINSQTHVDIICKIHGLFSQTPNNHLKYGCMKCGIERSRNAKRITLDEFIKRANKKHKNIYNYEKTQYIDSTTKVEIICQKHGSFFQTPNNHIRGEGCDKCIHKTETLCRLAFENITGKPFPKKRPKFLEGLEFDGYNEELKIAIEYHGIQHYKPVKFFGGEQGFKIQQERDKKKLRLSKLNNIILIVVPYTVTNFEKYFEDYFYFM